MNKARNAVFALVATMLMTGCMSQPVATPTASITPTRTFTPTEMPTSTPIVLPLEPPLTENSRAFNEATISLGTYLNYQSCTESSPTGILVPKYEESPICITGFAGREWLAPAVAAEKGELFLFLMASASETGELIPWEGKLFHIVDVPGLVLGVGPICFENDLVCTGISISAKEAKLLTRSNHVMPLEQ